MKDQKAIFLAGNLEKWDISIFFVLFCELDWSTVDNADENQTIRKVKEIRNTVMHVSFIQEKEFEALKYSLKDLLVDLGMPEALFDDVHVFPPLHVAYLVGNYSELNSDFRPRDCKTV
jgi:hypothetical protein